MVEVVDLGLRDPQRIHWSGNDDILYVLDRTNLSVLAAPYSGDGYGLPSAGAFQIAAQLASPVGNSVRLVGPPNGDPKGVAVWDLWKGTGPASSWLHVFPENGAWVSMSMSMSQHGFAPSGSTVWQTGPAFPQDSGPMYVSGRTGAYEVVDELRGAVVSTGRTLDDSVVSLAIPDALVPGIPYAVRDGGSASGLHEAGFVPLVRYGIAAGTSQIQTPKGTTVPVRVGDTRFSLIDHIRLQTGFSGSASADVYLWVCVRRPDGSDPVVDLGWGVMVLDPATMFASSGPQRVEMAGPEARGSFVFNLPIPPDDQLAGAVVLFQYLAVYGNEIAVSEVFGATILPVDDPGTFAQRVAVQTQRDGRTLPTAASNAAVARWTSNSAHAVGESRRAEALQWLARLRQSRSR